MHKACTLRGCLFRTDDVHAVQCSRCRAELSIVLEKGDQIEDFVIEESIASGKGGMATVYKARHIQGGMDVALKIAHGKPFQFDALFREADCLAQLEHPGIVRIVSLGQDRYQKNPFVHKVHLMGEPLSYMILEWVEGFTLQELMHLHPQGPPISEAVRIVSMLAEALEHAHTRSVIHLDIKPGNIMLRRGSGAPVLMDFGIARRLDKPFHRISEKNLGTAGYMSPEHIKGHEVGPQSDVFSLGVVLYALLAGVSGGPFKRDRTDATLTATVSEEPKPISWTNPALDARWDKIMARSLAKRPEDRFGSMLHFRQALHEAMQSRRWSFSRLTWVEYAILICSTIIFFGLIFLLSYWFF